MYKTADFVVFSHARHRAAQVECRACHGPVWERDTLTREVPTSMKACLDCHKAARASVSCTICHELTQ
ncbi:MAG: cytochrome c3 family protein [Bryobacteraceae bacterium]